MKKILSMVLVLTLVLGSFSMAFASTSNDVSRVPKVSDDKEFSESDAPVLRIEEDTIGDFEHEDIFRLTLDGAGAEWNYDDKTTVIGGVYEGSTTSNQIGTVVLSSLVTDEIINAQILFNDANKDARAAADADDEAMIRIAMDVTLDGSGDAKVIIDSRGTGVSSGTYTYAVASGGETVVTVASSKSIEDGSNRLGANIVIDETNVGALNDTGTQKFRLKLPSDFEWGSKNDETTVSSSDPDSIKITKVTPNGRNLDIEFTATGGDKLRSITITPYIDVTRDADYGDVVVTIDGQNSNVSDEDDLLIAEYKEYDATVTIEEVKEFFAGRLNDDDDLYTAKITIKENLEGSLLPGRKIEFTLPDWVKIVDENADGELNDIKIGNEGGDKLNQTAIKVDDNGYEFDITVPEDEKSGKTEWTLELPITAKANQTGDVELTVDGAGMEETELVIAEVIAPIEAEIEVADVKIGVQGQNAPDIIIKETKKGAIREDADLLVWFKDEFGFSFEDADFEVIDGDLEIDEDDAKVTGDGDRSLIIPIDSQSSKPSTIKISNIELTLDRTVPEGPFKVRIGGDAVVENYFEKDGDFFKADVDYDEDYYTDDFVSRVIEADFANVVTKAEGTVASTSKFVIDSDSYTVIEGQKEVQKTMDVAPFIQDGRTLLPVRYVAESLGANVLWDDATRTVTILKDGKVVQVVIDSNMLSVNGVSIPMDTTATISNARTFLPVRFVAEALGAEIAWDEATRTVTIEQ